MAGRCVIEARREEGESYRERGSISGRRGADQHGADAHVEAESVDIHGR